MTNPFIPVKKALLIATQHVRGEPGSRFSGLPDLVFAHRDAKMLQDKLITSHGYHPDNVVLMMDNKRHHKHLWPTYKNIMAQLERLTSNAPENCHILFYFSGHGLEEECVERARMRADGRDSEIICADGKPILDRELHKYLVEPLKNVKGSKLFALFDCCHSESLLDLQRGERPNSYSRAWAVGPGQLFKDVATVIASLSKLDKKHSHAPRPLRRASTKWLSQPTSNTREEGELSVICLSACRDRQLAHDDCELGLTFTKCFIDAVASKPNITWEELRDALKELISEIRMQYEEMRMQESLASSESHGSYEHWTQDPRFNNSSHTDLTRRVSF